MDFTAENNFFEDDELQFDQHKHGRPSIVDWDGVVDSGKWFFLPNSVRSESAVINDNRPSPPTRYLCDGYKFTMKKTTHPDTGEGGLAIKCTLYPDDV
jgi:hypothetical protein|tara:strand:- start:679 stop:972 length:294 start_codon:yes stop_codon:yes gene_type:complete